MNFSNVLFLTIVAFLVISWDFTEAKQILRKKRAGETCTETQYQCSDNLCLEAEYLCDDYCDCQDGSDEANCTAITVRLVDGAGPWEGRVEIVRNGLVGTVCDDEWDDQDATVICRMMGYNYGGVAMTGGKYGTGSGVIWLDEVECLGDEQTVDFCPSDEWNVHDCEHSEDAGVLCHRFPPTTRPPITTPDPYEITAYLVGGHKENEGNVGLAFEGQQYRICDDSWDNRDATVVCRMLGYPAGGKATKESFFGQDDSDIIMDEVSCSGTENSLDDCMTHFGIDEHGCGSDEHAGVICTVNEPQTTGNPGNSGADVCGTRPYDTKDLFLLNSLRNRRSADDAGILSSEFEQISSGHRVYGGDFAEHGASPWQARVAKGYNVRPDGTVLTEHWCGAVIISEYWLLSAAHCFWRNRKSQFRIVVGDHHQKNTDRGEQSFRVEKIINHPNYNDSSNDNDICLIKIQSINGRGIRFNDFVQPVCLPTARTPYVAGSKCVITGWGSTRAASYPNRLKTANVPLIGWGRCRNLYDSERTGLFTRRMFCAGDIEDGSTDTCDGDSGGPLACNVNGVYTLFGITAFGLGCGEPDAPGVYSRVSKFLPWINDVINRNSERRAEKMLPKRP